MKSWAAQGSRHSWGSSEENRLAAVPQAWSVVDSCAALCSPRAPPGPPCPAPGGQQPGSSPERAKATHSDTKTAQTPPSTNVVSPAQESPCTSHVSNNILPIPSSVLVIASNTYTHMERSNIHIHMFFISSMSFKQFKQFITINFWSKIDTGNYYMLRLNCSLSFVWSDRQNPAAMPFCTLVERHQELGRKYPRVAYSLLGLTVKYTMCTMVASLYSAHFTILSRLYQLHNHWLDSSRATEVFLDEEANTALLILHHPAVWQGKDWYTSMLFQQDSLVFKNKNETLLLTTTRFGLGRVRI